MFCDQGPRFVLLWTPRTYGGHPHRSFAIESPYLYNPALVSPTSACHLPPPGSCALLPVLTTFIPSITPNAAFRVSIHNWDKPRPSRLMDSLLQPDESSLFEARIFIDGNFVAYVLVPFVFTRGLSLKLVCQRERF